jgi:hypothetical protein
MIIIRNTQIEQLDRAIQTSWQREFKMRLREDLPNQTSRMNDEQLAEYVEQGFENAKELEIEEKEDIYRFLKLGFLPREIIESDFTQSIIIRVLNNLNLSSAKRLDFIEQQIVERKQS